MPLFQVRYAVVHEGVPVVADTEAAARDYLERTQEWAVQAGPGDEVQVISVVQVKHPRESSASGEDGCWGAETGEDVLVAHAFFAQPAPPEDAEQAEWDKWAEGERHLVGEFNRQRST